jgi:hypothetical protein
VHGDEAEARSMLSLCVLNEAQGGEENRVYLVNRAILSFRRRRAAALSAPANRLGLLWRLSPMESSLILVDGKIYQVSLQYKGENWFVWRDYEGESIKIIGPTKRSALARWKVAAKLLKE